MSTARLLVMVLGLGMVSISAQDRSVASATTEKGIISGTVVRAETAEPLAGIAVFISATAHRDESVQVVTGSDGSFVFNDVARGKYSLTAQGPGYSLQAYQQHWQYSTAIAVGPGLNSRNIIFQLVPDASISGIVVDEENDPVRTGQVFLLEETGKIDGKPAGLVSQTAALDDQGRYRIRHLRPGSYLVAVAAQPWYAQDAPAAPQSVQLSIDGESTDSSEQTSAVQRTQDATSLDVAYRTTFYPDAADPEMATPVQLRGGERATLDFTLRAVPSLHLTIRNLGKNPSQPTTAFVLQPVYEGASVPINARSQQIAPGFLRLSGLPPGHLSVNLRSFNGKEWKNDTREIDLFADAEIDASENSAHSVKVKGLVRLADGSPAVGAHIRIFNRATHEAYGAQISSNGAFELQETVPGNERYEVAIRNVPDSAVHNISAIGARVEGLSLMFPRAGSVKITVSLVKGMGGIDGTVLRDGKPVSSSMVLLIPQNLVGNIDLVRRDQSDSDGTFTLDQIVPGRYTLVAIANGWDLDLTPAVMMPYLEQGQVVEVTASRTHKLSVTEQDLIH